MPQIDNPTRSIVEFVRATDFGSIQPQAVHAIVRNYVDTVGCAAAGFDDETSAIARRAAAVSSGSPAASAFGVPGPVLVEFAVFANAASVSFGEFHDDENTRPTRSRIAPSLVALAESNGSNARELIAAVFVAYQLVMALGDDAPMSDTGYGQSLHLSIAVAAAASKLLRLTDDELANAIAIAITPSVPLNVAERLPDATWSATAAAHASMTAVLAARLAHAGMTGPPHIFDGAGAVWDTVTGPFEFTDISRLHGTLSVPERIAHRSYPAFRQGQGVIRMALDLRRELAGREIASVTIEATEETWRVGGGGEPARARDPHTPSGAYFSLPYLVARALTDGSITQDSLAADRVRDPRLRPLMRKIAVVENPNFTAAARSRTGEPARIEIELAGDVRLVAEHLYPPGHARNPLSDAELTAKFDASVEKVLERGEHRQLSDRLWNLPDVSDIGAITALFRRFTSPMERWAGPRH